MNIYYSYLILIFLLIFLNGCKNKQDMKLTDEEKNKMLMEVFKEANDPFSYPAEQVTDEQLVEDSETTIGDTLGNIRYMGRKNNFDYYLLNWNIGASIYKIKVPNVITQKVIPYSRNREKWLNVGPGNNDSWLPNKAREAIVIANLRSLPEEFNTIRMSGDFFSVSKIISEINNKLKINTSYKVINSCSEMDDDIVAKNTTLFNVIKYLCIRHKLKVTVKENNIILKKIAYSPYYIEETKSKDSKNKK